MAWVIDTHSVAQVDFSAATDAVDEVLEEVRELVRACAAPEVFSQIRQRLESAAQTEANLALQLLPMLAHWPRLSAPK